MKKFLTVFGPGLMIAATGVGAGDLATSALAGSKLGLSVVFAVVLGGLIKYVLNEGLARWQFDTGTTLIEGAVSYYGRISKYFFMGYLVIWSFLVAAALMSASGISMHALIPIFENPKTGKVVFGIGLSFVGLLFVRLGGYPLFEKIMSVGIVLMMISVFYTVLGLDFGSSVLSSEIDLGPEYWQWFLAVIGGVGGTVTLLCYGYWIREQKREGSTGLKISRVDLVLSYSITVIFGVCMVIIGSQIEVSGKGASLLIQLSETLSSESGTLAGWVFKVGAFAAIFSSLLGVWQSVPYLFVDLIGKKGKSSRSESKLYNQILLGIATLPIAGLLVGFAKMQKLYAISGAFFAPMLALTLILLGIQKNAFKNTWVLNVLLGLIFFFFAFLGVKIFF